MGEVRLPRPAAIEGIYEDENGRPLPGLCVMLGWQDRVMPSISVWSGHTDREGRFRFTGIPSGEFRVRRVEPFANRWADTPDFARVALDEGERVVVRRGDDLR